MYKLPVTISDETGSIDAIAFSTVAEELVELSAYLTSQNLKIDADVHVTPLDTAVGKMKLFNIGMSGSTSSSFTIKYILKKSFPIDASTVTNTLPDTQVQLLLLYYSTPKKILLKLFLHFFWK
jgi:hypothetical protein